MTKGLSNWGENNKSSGIITGTGTVPIIFIISVHESLNIVQSEFFVFVEMSYLMP
jgi:hypothetical protein